MIISSLRLYTQRNILLMLPLGFASGVPFLLIGATLSFWLKDEGLSKSAIGAFNLVTLPFALKLFWAPLIDTYKLGAFAKRLGHRKAWAYGAQVCLATSLLALSQSNPSEHIWVTAYLCVLIAFFSATQDIILDGLRINLLESHQQASGVAIFVTGYRLGLIVSGAGALFLADQISWPDVYILASLLPVIGMIALHFCPEPVMQKQPDQNFFKRYVAPFRDFIATYKIWPLFLIYMILFKFGDAFLGIMANPFYVEIGFEKTEIATVSKTYGVIATIAGGIIGGAIMSRIGVYKGLLFGAVLQMVSNGLFAYLATQGADVSLLTMIITVENISGGFGTAAFLSFLACLCNKQFSTTQYALFTSIIAVTRDIFGSFSGVVADQVNWPTFFLITIALSLPSVILTVLLHKHLRKLS